MSANREAQLASSVLALRTPLAGVELAASQLAREASAPGIRDLGERIREAVAELDRGIESCLRALAPEPPPRELVPCDGELSEVVRRMGPVLEARGCRCKVRPTAGLPVRGDPERVRRAALSLLRCAAAPAAGGGMLQLGLEEEEGRYGVSVELARSGGAEAGDPVQVLDEVSAAAREFALTHGAEVDVHWCPGAGSSLLRTTLWFPRRARP